jgi:hypothetical protein
MSKKCKIDKCKAPCLTEDIAYCFHHQSVGFKSETDLLGKKCCKNFVRGCRSQMEMSYNKSACPACLERERNKDKARRDACKKAQEEAKHKVAAGGGEVITELLCCCCCIMRPIEMYCGAKEGVQTITCQLCRDNNKRADLNRDQDRKLELSRIYENKPKRQFDQHLKSAKFRNIINELTFDNYINIAKNNCFYCEELHERGFNGINRQYASRGYILDNCVSSCKMCNYIKNDYTMDVFYKKIEHILTFNGKIQGALYPELFENHFSIYFKTYKNRAIDVKKFEFELNDENEFNLFIDNPCYICGKPPSIEHKNGIDRFDSNIGYTLVNIRPCCGDCNQMKFNFEYNDFMDKLLKIYSHTHNKGS